ncbi:MAG: ATP-dependent RNA helicase HrpA [Methylohalobius sp.]|nr:ATP-dependent RNA helicase HrpA [Methylohalobius sp.]
MSSQPLVSENRVYLPAPLTYPELPIAEKRDKIITALKAHQVIIVCGETGSGKTTQLPKICLQAGRGVTGLIGHTQPRRIAARSVAARIAQELGQELGGLVGCKVRFHDQTSPDTLIKVMTDGILLAEIQTDRYLTQYDTLIVDEAHERSLNIDFLLGYLKWLLPKRRDLKLIITSATLDVERLSSHFGGAPVIEVSGRSFPVEVRYRPPAEGDPDMIQAIVDGVDELAREGLADILVFLAGERDIREAAEALRKHHPGNFEILPLYARLPLHEQQRIFQPSCRPRVILATNVAETSLTVPGIRAVVDTGLARISRFSPKSRLQRLPIEPISQASAKQRAGRCGRIAPGVALRLYSEEDFNARPLFTDPEILRTNLAAVILRMKALGLGEVESFPFIDSPESSQIRAGIRLLKELEALDANGELTQIGSLLLRFPIDPRLARMLVEARKENCLSELVVIASALSIQDPRERPIDQAEAADAKHALWRDESSDFLSFLKLWRVFAEHQKHLSKTQLRKFCRDHFLSYFRMREWQDLHAQLMEVIKGELGWRPNQQEATRAEVHRAVLAGFLSYVGLRKDKFEYEGAYGRKFFIFPGSSLFKARPNWLVCAEQVETTKVYGRICAQVEPQWIEAKAHHLLNRHYFDPHWERKARKVVAFERVTLFGLTLVERRKVAYARIHPAEAREIFIRSALVEQDIDLSLEFFRHNCTLLAELKQWQHKTRRLDGVVEEARLFEFYKQRIPTEVVDADSLERWYRKAVRVQPDLLKLEREAIAQSICVSAADFPDFWQQEELKLALNYRFDPGSADDGISVIVPPVFLPQLDPVPFDWLVPGWLEEKIMFLLKGLPRSARQKLMPIAETAAKVRARLNFGKGLLWEEVAHVLKEISALEISPQVLAAVELPDYLRMNFKVVDDSGQILAQGRNLELLKAKFLSLASKGFQSLSKQVGLARGGIVSWDFGDLPHKYPLKPGVLGFPALVDEGESCRIQVFTTVEEAKAAHRQGIVRLVQLALMKEIKLLKKQLPITQAEELVYAKLPPHPLLYAGEPSRALTEELIELALGVLLEGTDIRSQQAFAEQLAIIRGKLFPLAQEMALKAKHILELVQTCREQCYRMGLDRSPSGADVNEQLTLLCYQGFLHHTPWTNLKELPRYLTALRCRLDKAAYDLAKDESRLNKLKPFWESYWKRVQAGEIKAPDLDPVRWSLEEFRIQLFAQHIKTAYPVSEKRLAAALRTAANV